MLAVVLGIVTLARARHAPGGSFGGASTVGALAELGGAWSLVASGLLFANRHPRNLVGPLLVAAGLSWFLPEWSNPGVGTAFGFTAGLALFAACVPLAAHAALAYPGGRLQSLGVTVALASAYVGAVGLLGLLPAAVFDPHRAGCGQCPRNLLLVHADLGLYSAFNRWGLRLGIGWVAALGAACLWQLTRTRATLPVLAPTCAYLAFVGWEYEHALGAGFLGNDAFAVRSWRYQAMALAALAGGIGWGFVRERRARTAVARLVVELARAPRLGGLRDALAEALGDQSVVLAYRRSGTDQYVDGHGKPLVLEPSAGQAVTPVRRGEATVAALVHDGRLLDEPGLLTEVVSAAQLALANEQLQAEARAQLKELSASRARIVEAGDTARQRLEHDLHDGAQQRIVGLSLAVQLLRTQLGPIPDAVRLRRLETVTHKLDTALDELREVAHGLYPAVLFDQGLGAAVEMLAERSASRIEVEKVVDGRLPSQVENAAYFAVAEAVKDAALASVAISRRRGQLVVTVDRHGDTWRGPDRLQEIADRVGALDGRVTIEHAAMRAEIPCGS